MKDGFDEINTRGGRTSVEKAVDDCAASIGVATKKRDFFIVDSVVTFSSWWMSVGDVSSSWWMSAGDVFSFMVDFCW